MVKQWELWCGIVIAVIVSAGCGGNLNSVRGTVRLADGSPVSTGRILFTSAKSSASGTIGQDGSYQLGSIRAGDGAAAGTYAVAISASVSAESLAQPLPTTPAEAQVYREDREVTWLVDPRFANPETSGLEAQVVSGKNIIDFTVSPPTGAGRTP